LSTRLAATSFVMAYLPRALERLRPLSDAEFNEILANTTQASCKFYTINDKNKNRSQFLVINVDSRMEKFTVEQLGKSFNGFDLEGLAIHPVTKIIYTTSGDDVDLGKFPGYLYVIDAKTGEITLPIGSTGFDEVASIIFAPNGTLYGWAKDEGLITIDIRTGKGTLVLPSDRQVEDLALSKEIILYGAENTNLLKYQPTTNSLEVQCDNLPGETESLEMLTDNMLLLGIHNSKWLQVFDIERCQLRKEVRIPTGNFKDIEGIGVIVDECPLGELVDTAVGFIEEDIKADTKQVCLSLDKFEQNQLVDGLDTVHLGLDIDTFGKAKVIIDEQGPRTYNDEGQSCIGKGIWDKEHRNGFKFTLNSDATFSDFSLQLLDFSAYEPTIKLSGYDLAGNKFKGVQTSSELCSMEEVTNHEVTGEDMAQVRLSFTSNIPVDESSEPEDSESGDENVIEEISEPYYAIGNICFTAVPTPDGLPDRLLRTLSKEYISEQLNEFIVKLHNGVFASLSKEDILESLIKLEKTLFREYIDGLPNDLLVNFLNTLPEEVPANYSNDTLDDLFEDYSDRNFEQKLLSEVSKDFIIERLDYHFNSTLQNLRAEKVLPLLPGKLLRNELSGIVGNMMANITDDLLAEVSAETLLEVLDELPVYILNKLLDDYNLENTVEN
ncbi:hypothetical protein QUF50_07500, partial [Thiotrichales bacterium HSG1]|nr:hypothetical protein [Thiotrichales bacterium HSG1]